MNTFDEDDFKTPVESFWIHGHGVKLFSPTYMQITIAVDWAENHRPSLTEQTVVVKQTENVVRYMKIEGILDSVGLLNILVMTKHLKQT